MIRFYCPCGKRLKARVKDAGRVAKCSKCGAKLRVPEAPALDDPREALAQAAGGGGSFEQKGPIPTAEVVEPAPAKPSEAPAPAPPQQTPQPASDPLQQMLQQSAPGDGAASALEALAGTAPQSAREPAAEQVSAPASQPAGNGGAGGNGLEALAEILSTNPGKDEDPMKRVRKRVSAAGGPGSAHVLMGKSGNGGSSKKTPVVIGIAAGVLALGLIVGLVVYGTTRGDEEPTPEPEPTRSSVGSTAGELFPGVESE